MHVTNWATAQKEDPKLYAVLQWLESKLKTDLRTLLREHASLYLHSTPKGEDEDLLLFVVPKMHWTATWNGYHRDAGHQGRDHTVSLLQECFWWPGMAKQMRQVIKACKHCLQYEGGTPKAPFMPYSGYHSPGSLTC